ncbi:MAG: HEPN domain-containing protein [Candidatus Baldrarchaeota archaeon]
MLFYIEQFLQLHLKHLLYKKTGNYTKTHSVVRLTRDLVKVCGENRLKRFYERNLEILYLLEKAYTFKISAQGV